MSVRQCSAAELLREAGILCIKIGSSLLMPAGQKGLRLDWIGCLAEDIAGLHGGGVKVVLISSGAVAAARHRGVRDSETLVRRQALAAVGQPRLMMAYAMAFDAVGLEIAQVLMNPTDTEDRRRHLNVRGTLEELLDCGVVPIINENDTLSSQALRYGDNDRLAARVGGMINADSLVMLSDVDGLYTASPRCDLKAELIPWLGSVTAREHALAGESGSLHGSGGMRTKLLAAEMCLGSNCHMILASGQQNHPLEDLLLGGVCTVFQAEGTPIQARKRWLSGLLAPRGRVVIDAGAVGAILGGNSLLAAGVTGIQGTFQRGDAVAIVDQTARVLGHGLINYSAEELDLIKGAKSAEIARLLGYVREKTLMHRDNFMLRERG